MVSIGIKALRQVLPAFKKVAGSSTHAVIVVDWPGQDVLRMRCTCPSSDELSLEFKSEVPGRFEENAVGITLVDLGDLVSIADNSDNLSFNTDMGLAEVSSGWLLARAKLLDGSDPRVGGIRSYALPQFDFDGPSIELGPSDIERIDALLPITCNDPTREMLCGVQFKEGKAAATNTHHLGVVDLDTRSPLPFVVPKTLIKAALELMRRTCDADRIVFTRSSDEPRKAKDVVSAHDSEKPVLIRAEVPGSPVRYTAHEALVRFPNWEKVLDHKPPTLPVEINPTELAFALKTIEPAARRDSRRCALHFHGLRLGLSAGHNDNLCVDHAVDLETDFELSLSLNVQYFLEGLRLMDGSPVTWTLNTNPVSPVRLDCPGRLYLLMPMQSNEESAPAQKAEVPNA